MSFAIAKVTAQLLDADFNAACKVLKAITSVGSGPFGLTPDSVKLMPQYRIAKAHVDKTFAELRAFNQTYVKRFKKELAAERKARRAAI